MDLYHTHTAFHAEFNCRGSNGKDAEFTLTIDSLNLQMGISGNLVLSLVNAQNAGVTEIKGTGQL